MKCPKCEKEFTSHPAKSRIDNSMICPLCGSKEALDAAIKAGAITTEDAKQIIDRLSQMENYN